MDQIYVQRPQPAYIGDGAYVFVSYSHQDEEVVFSEIRRLQENGINVWWDEGISPGAEWREEVTQALQGCSSILYYITPHSVESGHCRREINFGVDQYHRPVLSVHLVETTLPDALGLVLSDRQAILKPDLGQAEYERKLFSAITTYLDQPLPDLQPVIETAEKRKNTIPILASMVIVIALGAGLFFFGQQDKQQTMDGAPAHLTEADLIDMRSVAVLPFANMSTSQETGFFAEGLSEDIIDHLAQLKEIKVASSSDSFQFKDREKDSSAIGRQLKVAYLVNGSVRQQGENVRITTQLIRTEDGFQVWTKSYERFLSDGFKMQTAVASNVAFIVESKLKFDIFKNHGWKVQKEFDGIDTVAIQHYMDARNEFINNRLGEGGKLETYLQFLKNAVEADPDFDRAHSAIAFSYFLLRGKLPIQEARTAAHAAIAKAIALAPDAVGSQWSLAVIQLYLDLDYARAESAFSRRLKHDPGYGFAHLLLANIALREGRRNDAIRELNMASFNEGVTQSDFFQIAASISNFSGDYEGALKAAVQGLKLTLGGAGRSLLLRQQARSLIGLNRIEEAKRYIDEGWQLDGSRNPEFYIAYYTNIGEIEKSRKILGNLHSDSPNNFYLASGYLALGDIDNTFKSIRAGIEDHNQLLHMSLMLYDMWDPVRADPRFDEMLELLDLKVTHTEKYLRDRDIEPEE